MKGSVAIGLDWIGWGLTLMSTDISTSGATQTLKKWSFGNWREKRFGPSLMISNYGRKTHLVTGIMMVMKTIGPETA